MKMEYGMYENCFSIDYFCLEFNIFLVIVNRFQESRQPFQPAGFSAFNEENTFLVLS